MQAIPILSFSPSFGRRDSPNEYLEFSAKISEDFSSKLKFESSNGRESVEEPKRVENEDDNNGEAEPVVEEEEDDDDDDGEEEEEEEEFSFACMNPDGSPISAADVFQNGEIRPVFPFFNRDLLFPDAYGGNRSTGVEEPANAIWPPLKKLFVEEHFSGDANPSSSVSESAELEGIPEGTYCEWSGKSSSSSSAAASCKKSNSTGFSRLWRFRDLVHRSNSDGKDAFVFLNPNNSARTRPTDESAKKTETVEKERKKSTGTAAASMAVNRKAKRSETASSVQEKHYVRNRARKEGDKRRSYLPYRQDLVGFFTNVNGMTRNVHPF